MNENQFVYWLQGFVELNPQAMLTLTQWQIVKDHLALVFKKETPVRGIPLPVSPRPTESALDRVLDDTFKQPSWMTPTIQWPPGTIIC
jgi:hypothetical protein